MIYPAIEPDSKRIRPNAFPNIGLIFLMALFGAIAMRLGAEDLVWEQTFKVNDLPQFSPIVISAPHRALLRAALNSGELVWQDLDTGHTNRSWSLGVRIKYLVLAPNGRRVYVGSNDPDLGAQQRGLIEIDLESPANINELAWRVPEFAHGVVITDDRVAVASVPGNFDPPYRLKVIDLATGTVGAAFVSASARELVLSRDQHSVFAELPTQPTQSRVNRITFNANNQTFGARQPMQERESNEFLTLPFGFTEDNALVLNEFGAFRNAPGVATDLERLANWQLLSTLGMLENPQVPDTIILLGNLGLQILQREIPDGGGFWRYPVGQAEQAAGVGESVYAVLRTDVELSVQVMRARIPWNQLATNQPPTISLVTSPEGLNTADDTVLDASGTTDDVSPLSRLQFRWDLDGDGQFDREFSAEPKLVHRFSTAGDHAITLEVRDEYGSRSRLQRTISVSSRLAPAYRINSTTPWEIDFSVGAALFDTAHRRLFCMDEAHRRLVEISLTNGLAVRAWPVDYRLDAWGAPGGTIVNLALSLDGNSLFAGERRPGFNQTSTFFIDYLVEYELGDGVADLGGRGAQVGNLLYIQNFAPTPDGFLAVGELERFSLRRWPETNVVSQYHFDLSGIRVVSVPAPGVVNFSIYPSVGGSIRLIRLKYDSATGARLETNGVTVIGNGIFGAANGRYIISDQGSIFEADATGSIPFKFLGLFPSRVGVLGLDLPERELIAMRGDGFWDFVRTRDWSPLVSQSASYFNQSGPTLAAGADDQFLYELVAAANGKPTRILRRVLPAVSATNNLSPSLSWIHPAGPFYQINNNIIKFTASADDADGTITNLTLLNHGVVVSPVPNLPDPPTPPPGEWWVFPRESGLQEFQLVATDNLGATSKTEKLVLRYNNPPLGSWLRITNEVLKSPVSFHLEVSASDSDPEDAITSVNFILDSSGTQTVLQTITNPPWRAELIDFVGYAPTFRAEISDRFGGLTVISTNLSVDPLPGQVYSQPLTVDGESFTVRASSRTSPREPAFIAPGPFNTGFSGRWWEWRAPRDLEVDIDTIGSSFDTYMEVVRPDIGRPSTLQNNESPLSRPWSRMKLSVRSNEVYRIGVAGGSLNEVGDIVLNLRSTHRDTAADSVARPTNDITAGAVLLESGANTVGTTRGAIFEFSNPRPPRLGLYRWAGASVWYRWTAASNTWVRIQVASTQMDPVIRVGLQRIDGGLGILVAENDDVRLGSTDAQAIFGAAAGTTYLIQVVGATEQPGDFQIRLEEDVPPLVVTPTANGRWQDAIQIPNVPIVVLGSIVGLTASGGIPEDLGKYPTSWYTWTAPSSGTVWWWLDELSFQLLSPGSGFERRVYRVDDSGVLTWVDTKTQRRGSITSDQLRFSFQATAGSTYLLAFSSSAPPSRINFSFSLTLGPGASSIILSPPIRTSNGWNVRASSSYHRYIEFQESNNLINWRRSGLEFLRNGIGDFSTASSPDGKVFYRSLGIE